MSHAPIHLGSLHHGGRVVPATSLVRSAEPAPGTALLAKGFRPLFLCAAAYAVLAVPLFDLVMVTWIRLRRGQPIYQGDVNHISHRLVRLGLPQSWAVTLIYLITLTLGLGATVLLWSELTAALIVIVQAICILAIVTLLERLGGK